MSNYSGESSSSRKRGRPPNQKKESAIKRLREINGITKEIKIILKRCDKQLNCTRCIDLPPPTLEVNGVIPSPSSSLASYPAPLLRREIDRTTRPKLTSKSKKVESDLHKSMAPGVKVSSPRSSKRLQNGANTSSNLVNGQVGEKIGSSSSSSSDAPQVSSKKKLSRYPRRLRSAHSSSNSQDGTVLPEEEKSKSTESVAISKARKIKKKIMESRLPSLPPPAKKHPAEAEAPPTAQVLPRGLPCSRSNSEDDIEIIDLDDEPSTSPPTTALSNGRQVENGILESEPPLSPPPPKILPKKEKVTKSRSATPPSSEPDELIILDDQSSKSSKNVPLSSTENGREVDFIDKLLESPPRVKTPTPHTEVLPKRRRGKPSKSSISASPNSPAVPGPSTSTSSPLPVRSTRERTRKANIPIPVPLAPEPPSKSNSLLSHSTELEMAEEVVNSSVIASISSPPRPPLASQSLSSLDGATTSPPEGRMPMPSQVIRTPSPCKEPVSGTDKPSNSRDINSVVVTNGPVLPQLDESEEDSDDDLEDFEKLIRSKMMPTSVQPNALSFQTKTNSLSCLANPQPCTSKASSEKHVPVTNGIILPPPPTIPPPLQTILESTPRKPTDSPLQNALPHPRPSPPEDEVVEISTDEEDSSRNLEIVEVKSLAQKNFLLSPFPTPAARVVYYSCVMWDLKIMNELQYHEDSLHQLYIANSIGKLLSESVKSEGHSFPGVAQMDWRRKFILLDIITADFTKCGIFTCLRVQEKASIDTIKHLHHRPPKWDLVIHPQCIRIGEEMVRKHRSGVKTTVIIWGAHISKYPQPWNDTQGEIILTPSKKDSEALSVIIFHHETLSHERFRLIQDAHLGSELWPNFQDPQLNHRLFMQAELVHGENPTHFTLHAEKLRNPESYKATVNNVNVMEVEEEDCEEVTEFPEFDSCDDEDFEMEDDEFSLYPDPDEWDDLESASCLGVGSAGENVSSPDVQASVSQDMHELAARIFRRSHSVPAILTSPRRDVNAPGPGDLCNSPPSEHMGRRTSDPPMEIDGVGAGAGTEVDSNKVRVVSDSQKQFLLTQELVDTDDEDEVDNGNVSNGLEKTVLTCDEDFVTGDEGPSPALASLLRVAKAKSKSPTGTKVKKGKDQTNLCNGYGPSTSTPTKKMNLTQNGKVASKDKDKVKSVNGTENPPPSNTEHSEYNYSALLQEF